MDIVEAKISDFDDIKVISDNLRKLHIQNRPDMFKDILTFDMEYFSTFFGDNVCYVAKENNLIVGYILLKVIITKENDTMVQRKIVYIDEIGVKEEYRNRGIGSILLKSAEEYAKDIDADVIDFKVWNFNKNAINFYINNGYNIKAMDMEKWI